MVSILDEAMQKLNTRSDLISDERTNEENHISELNKQISDLEAMVADSMEKVASLNSEQAMITKNIKSLEKMKALDVSSEIKSETSTKVHNVKRQKVAA